MSQPSDTDVTRWLRRLDSEDSDEAARKLWEYYIDQVLREARKRFRTTPRRVADEEDVAVSVFDNLFRKARAGRFAELADRNELRALLFKLTKDKVFDRIKQQNAQKRGDVRGDSVFAAVATNGILDPAADRTAVEELLEFIAALPSDALRRVAELRVQGHSREEIATALDLKSVRVVEYKLTTIRRYWSEGFDK